MPVPTPISVRSLPSIPSSRPARNATESAAASVPTITGSVDAPTEATWPRPSVAPRATIAACRTYLPVNAMPGRSRASGARIAAARIPSTRAKTGGPTSGSARPSGYATSATAAAAAAPDRSVLRRLGAGNAIS